jgi:hypothetical protein
MLSYVDSWNPPFCHFISIIIAASSGRQNIRFSMLLSSAPVEA